MTPSENAAVMCDMLLTALVKLSMIREADWDSRPAETGQTRIRVKELLASYKDELTDNAEDTMLKTCFNAVSNYLK